MRVLETKNDVRGEVLVIEHLGRDYLFIFTKAGYMRGGEVHKGKQWNIMLSGEALWEFPNGETYSVAPGTVEIPKMTPHMMTAVRDCLMLEWREKPIENPVIYYEPYRDLVLNRMIEKALVVEGVPKHE